MAKQTIDIGSSPNKGDGDPLRTAFTKINQNFNELYAGGFADPDSVGSNLSPDTDATYNLGAADKQWADVHISDFLYLNGQRIEALPNGTLLVNGSGARESADIVGSVFGDDSTLLVDGINNLIPSNVVSGIEADRWTEAYSWGDHDSAGYLTTISGTVTGSLIPDANEAYDLGSATHRFRDLYLSGSTLNLGGTTLSVVGGELQLGGVKVPTTADVAATVASAVSAPTGDLKGSVFADDSTLLVDGVNGKLIGDVVTTSITNSRDIDIASEDDVAIITSAGDSNYEWFFNSGGYLDFPDNGELHFNGDAGIQFFTPYDPEAGTTANITIRDTGSTAELDIVNEATNGTIDITTEGILTLRTTANDMRLYAADDFYFEAGEGANDFTVNAGLIELDGDVELDGTLTFPDATVQSTAYVERFVNRSLFTGNATVTSGSANLLQFDAYQGQQAFDEVTYQWTPANTGLYRIDFVVGVTQGQVDIPFIAFLYNVTANSGQLQLFNGSFSGIVMSMSGTIYLTAGQSYQIGIIQTSGSDITLDSNLTSVGIEELTRV